MKKFGFIIILFITIFLLSCKAFKQYEDTNGADNYALQSITEEMLIKESGGLQVGAISNNSTKNGVTSIYSKVHQFDGVNELHKIKKGNYVMKVSFVVTSGNTRLVITDGTKIIKEFEVNNENQEYVFSCDKTYYLKLAGESCEYELNIEIKNN